MDEKDIFKEIGMIAEKFVLEADVEVFKKQRKHLWLKIASAACFVAIIGIAGMFLFNQSNSIELSDASTHVKVKYVDNAPNVKISQNLMVLTEQELFSEFNTSVFKGIVTEINNIQIKFNNEKMYQAIVKIKVEKVYRGECRPGDTVSVLLDCPIEEGVFVTDTETVSAMKTGMTGIFMPSKYTEESYYEAYGATLALLDIAEYGFPDGLRYAFLETDEGIVFSKWAYKSIENATTLTEIEAYVEKMINAQ